MTTTMNTVDDKALAVASLPSVEVNLCPVPASLPLSEIAQHKNVRFAFLSGGAMQAGAELSTFHPFVKCRDFLNDVIVCKDEERPFTVYGFSITPAENLLENDATKLILEFPNFDERDKFIRNFGAMNRLEKEVFPDIAPSELYHAKVKKEKPCLAIKADKKWQQATFLISLYTFWCRVVLYLKGPEDNWLEYAKDNKDGSEDVPRDQIYLHNVKRNKIEIFLPQIKNIDFSKAPTKSGFAKGTEVYHVHDGGGIQSLLTYATDKAYEKKENTKYCSAFAVQLRRLAAG